MDVPEESKDGEIINVGLTTDVKIDISPSFIDDAEEDNQNPDGILFKMNETNTQIKVDLSEQSENTLKDMVFMVPTLLAVRTFASQERMAISIQEIQRRVGPPESLSQSLLLGLLRMNKERANQLREALLQFGISELPGRPAVVSSFTKLSETEAKTVAEDYYYLASKYMNIRNMNRALVTSNGGAEKFHKKAIITKEVLGSILAEIEKRDMNMNLLTHGFSSYILKAVFNIIIELITYNSAESIHLDGIK